MKRGFWFVAGASAGVYVSARVRRFAEAFTVDGVRDRVSALQHGGRLLREDVVEHAQIKEAQLRSRIEGHDAAALGTSKTDDMKELQ